MSTKLARLLALGVRRAGGLGCALGIRPPISRIEATFVWMPWLEPIDANIAWLRASGTRWKEICWEVGLARAAAHEHWLYALCVIAWGLNGRGQLKGVGRRRLIARVRFGAVSGPPA